jgi:hypothetical protein
MTRWVLLLLLCAAILAPPVAAHGDGGARGYRSAVTSVRPATGGLTVLVVDGDDRLRLTNQTGRTVEIEGYEGEPYLRFATDGVFRNSRSPATYLNEERYGEVDVPADADPKAQPVWERVGGGHTYEWHDHRIHWMSQIDPPAIRTAPDEPHHVYDWRVPASIGGDPLVIAGRLDYEPPPAGGFTWRWIVPPVALVLAAAAFWWRRRRASASGTPRSRAAGAPPGSRAEPRARS